LNDRSLATVLLVFSLLFCILLGLTAVTCSGLGVVQLVSSASFEDLTPIFLFAIGLFWCGLLLLPTVWLAVQRLRGRAEQPGPLTKRWSSWLPSLLMLLVYPLVLLLGSQLARNSQLSWWILPVLQIPAATLPVVWLTSLALRRLSTGTHLKRWGIFGLGLSLGPGLIMVFELGAIFLILIAFVVYFGSDQTRAVEMMILAQRLQYAEANPTIIASILEPYLLQPVVLLGVLGFIAVLVPLIEETLKPIGVWLLAGQTPNPAQGFAAGVLSGAGYALFENLFITAPGEQWALISIGRIGTTTMHILTAGLTGYALAGAWSRGRYLRLGLFFGLSILIHALWNGLTLLSLVSALPKIASLPVEITRLGQFGGIALVSMYFLVFLGLIFTNRIMRRYAIIPAPETQLPASIQMDPLEFDPGQISQGNDPPVS